MHIQHTMDTKKAKGFTLLELLIVIAILAILATVVVLVLNPAETLKKTRDAQRLSDMNTLRAATALYVIQVTEPLLDSTAKSNTNCLEETTGTSGDAERIWVSYPSDSPGENITADPPSPFDADGGNGFKQVTTANLFKTDVNGWIPVQYSVLKGGPPISNLPVDPTNTVVDVAAITNSDFIYRYSCRSSLASNNSTTFEFNAAMESDDFKPAGGSDKAARDGGNNSNLYEVGTDLTILPGSDDF